MTWRWCSSFALAFIGLSASSGSARGQCYSVEQDWLTASDAAASSQFGWSVALSGDTVVIGARYDDHAAGQGAGSAYVSVRSGTVWNQQDWLTASDAAANSAFGYSVALSGDTVVIGAPDDDHAAGSNAGSAYVFVRSGAVWSEQDWLTASDDAAANSLFAWSVALSGDTAVIGAPFEDLAAEEDAGSAYVFVRSGTVWAQQARFVAPAGSEDDEFGYSVAISGDTAVMGAPYYDHAAVSNAGSAYVFVRSGTVWTQQALLTASDADANSFFGWSVALSGDTLIIGSIFDSSAGFNAGSAYVFVRSGAVWNQQARFVASDSSYGDTFGLAVALSGNFAVIGAPFDDHAAGQIAGSAYVFDLTASLQSGDLDGNQAVDSGDVAMFVDVLLGQDPNWLHRLAADTDCSDTVDGLDVAPFVSLLLN
ncbi:MAG TPA: FG-GAP repeat protein [Phycisphaerae bacterium]|nr:FG-GAP repeat protein [Phycisphaerae bacterium]